jgi:hypothetical protein
MRLFKHLCLVLAFFALPGALWAQVDTGSVSGTVTDPNGAVVPGAKVVATHVPTGRQFSIDTSQGGLYVFPNLPTGPYTLSVKQTGFKGFVQSGIEVRVGLRETIDIKLELGMVQQTVEVKAAAPVLETDNPTRGTGISPQTLTTLPLWNGGLELANAFVSYMPGVNNGPESSINGSIGRASEVLIDGATLVSPESGGVSFYFPGFYAFSEMKLVTSGFTAENGRVGGGIQEYVTRSGTNAVHGAALFNWKRDIFDANSWAQNQNPAARTYNGSLHAQAQRLKERYNEEGGYAGGPVYLPHIYDGRNRTFWYFTWIGFWQPASIGVSGGETTPTAKMKQGDFTEWCPATTPCIYDPATSPRVPFGSPGAYNIVPTNRFSTIAKNILPYIPAPNAGTPGQTTGNYTYNNSTITTDRVWSAKIDHSIKSRQRVAFFVTHRKYVISQDLYWPGPLSQGLDNVQAPTYYRASHDFVLSPHILLHSVWGMSKDAVLWHNPLQDGWGTKLGFGNLQAGTNQNATPVIAFENDLTQSTGGYNGYTVWGVIASNVLAGKVNNGGQWNWTTTVAQTLTWVHAKHEFRMGWDVRRLRTIGNDWAGTEGGYSFSRVQTAPSASTAGGNSFASFLLGDANYAYQGALPVFLPQIRYGYHAGFFQDTWRIRPHFTFNLGLRFEVPIGWHMVDGSYSSFSPTAVNPTAGNLPGAMIFMGSGPNRIGALRPYPTDFQEVGPRAGFAWNVKPSVVVRGAWGIYYEAVGNGGCGCTDGFGGGTFAQTSDGFNPAFQWDPGGYNPNKLTNNPGGVQPPASFKPAQQIPGVDNFANTIYYQGPKYGKAPRIYDYNFTIQKEFKNWLFEGAYVGNRAVGLNSSVPINTLPTNLLYLGTAGPASAPNLLQSSITNPNICTYASVISCTNGVPNLPFPTFMQWGGGATLAQALRPYPQFGNVYSINSGDGRSWYDAFQSKVEHRFGDLNFMASYVWSRTLDMLSYRQIFFQGIQQGAQDSYNLPDAKSYMVEDYPHFVNIVTSYRLPFGRGKKFLANANGVLDQFVGGWTFASTQQYRSGLLIQVTNPTNYLNQELFDTLTKVTATGLPIRTTVASTSLDPNNPNIRWFNSGTNAPYSVTPAFKLGNASYYNSQFRNPWLRAENISLSKRIKIRESVQLNYQVNVFNPFNRTDFGGIQSSISNANFGRPTGPQVGARVITMGARLEF